MKSDLELIEEALDCDYLTDRQAEIVADMADKLERYQLRPKQRALLESFISREPYEAPDETPLPASAYPRGREVPVPPALRNLPLRPPGRRA